MKWHIGCTGYGYKEWRDIFYRDTMAEKKWFNFYTSQFNTLELNFTFYHFPTIEKLTEWYKKTPDNYCFSIKVPKIITHFKQLVNADILLAEFYHTCKIGLRDKLGPLLFQFPPKFDYTQDRLNQLINTLDTAYTNVVEFRHISWWNVEVFSQLAKHNITFCGISHPLFSNDIVINGAVVYYRFHGVPTLYSSDYKENILIKFADVLTKNSNVKEVYCYFNNTAANYAIKNGLFLKKYNNSKMLV